MLFQNIQVMNQKVKKVMMWYSTNSVPIHKVGELQVDQWLNKDIVNYIDEHFVWNSGQALDLKKQGVIHCKIVGSTLFYTKKFTKGQENFITYFDVTPLSNADTIYSVDSCVLALKDITNSILELNEKYSACFILRVKPKRSYSRLHSSEYISTLKKFRKEGKLQIVDWNENLYSCIGSSRAILSVPYSSPIEVGNEMGTPGAYYFDGGTEWKLASDQKKAPLFTDKNQLKSWLENTVYLEPLQAS
jgi:polysaccharide biosynthesis PFTS motif protein